MEPIRALIVDDEPLARERIRALLAGDHDVLVVGECRDGAEAVHSITDCAPDLVFLDVQMPERDGFAVVEAVGLDRLPAIIFVTAYDAYALRAFEVSAVDYLLKPFDEERFTRALTRAKAQVRGQRSDDLERRLLALMGEVHSRTHGVERLMIKAGGSLFFLKTAEIDWIQAEGNYVRLHTGKTSHLMRETINNLEEQLDPGRFLRIHRSTIVNLDRVGEIQPLFHGEYRVILADGTRLTLSRGYRDRLSRFGK